MSNIGFYAIYEQYWNHIMDFIGDQIKQIIHLTKNWQTNLIFLFQQ